MHADENHYFVYIFGGDPGNGLQIGTAGDLHQHLQYTQQQPSSHAQKLVYYEHYSKQDIALAREKQIKESSHSDNQRLIESMNPNWLDLSDLL